MGLTQVSTKGVKDGSVAEVDLDITNDGTDGQYLKKAGTQFTWDTVSGGGGITSDAQQNTVGGTNSGDSFTGTDANSNTLYGYNSGTAITTGDYNVAVGDEAGAGLTTSSYGTFVGYKAGKTYSTENQFGASAICIGAQAGENATGTQSTFIGTKAGQTATGSQCVIIGNEVAKNRTGNETIAIGVASQAVSGAGTANVSIGNSSLNGVTSGSDNCALGHSAGSTLTTGSNCTFLGHDAAPSAVDVSNEVTIGDANVTKFRLPGLDGFQIDDNGTIDLPGAIDENVYECTGTELDPDLGTVQYKTLGANTTFTESFTTGQSMMLKINDGSSYTVTWPTIKWLGASSAGSAPTLATTGYTCIELWKMGSDLYGALIGVSS